jgi:hypothetical protein
MQKLIRQMVRITEPQHAFLVREAERYGISVTEALRRILDEVREARERQQPTPKRKS